MLDSHLREARPGPSESAQAPALRLAARIGIIGYWTTAAPGLPATKVLASRGHRRREEVASNGSTPRSSGSSLRSPIIGGTTTSRSSP